jgi:hypothetical protein
LLATLFDRSRGEIVIEHNHLGPRGAEKIFFSYGAILKENRGFTLNADNLINRLIRSRWISLLAVMLFFLSGGWANADPVGDFFKKVGQSISNAFQPQPAQQQTRKTRSSRRPISRESNIAEATPTPREEPPKAAKEEKLTPTVLPASAAPAEKAKGDMPYGIPVPGQKGMVTSPYLPEGSYIDVSAFAPGSAVKDPYTGKIFRVP